MAPKYVQKCFIFRRRYWEEKRGKERRSPTDRKSRGGSVDKYREQILITKRRYGVKDERKPAGVDCLHTPGYFLRSLIILTPDIGKELGLWQNKHFILQSASEKVKHLVIHHKPGYVTRREARTTYSITSLQTHSYAPTHPILHTYPHRPTQDIPTHTKIYTPTHPILHTFPHRTTQGIPTHPHTPKSTHPLTQSYIPTHTDPPKLYPLTHTHQNLHTHSPNPTYLPTPTHPSYTHSPTHTKIYTPTHPILHTYPHRPTQAIPTHTHTKIYTPTHPILHTYPHRPTSAVARYR